MKILNVVILQIVLQILIASQSTASPIRLPSIYGLRNEPPSHLLDNLKKEAREKFDEIKKTRNSKTVGRGLRLEIVISEDNLYINGEKLNFGDSIDVWKKKMSGTPRCFDDGLIFCVWDDFGLEVGTEAKKNKKVKFLNIYMKFKGSYDGVGKIDEPFGKTPEEIYDWLPHHVFSGYLELDGFGIDGETKFWKIKSNAKSYRNLRCGLRDCTHPHGMFSENAGLYLTLDASNENGTLIRFGITADTPD